MAHLSHLKPPGQGEPLQTALDDHPASFRAASPSPDRHAPGKITGPEASPLLNAYGSRSSHPGGRSAGRQIFPSTGATGSVTTGPMP